MGPGRKPNLKVLLVLYQVIRVCEIIWNWKDCPFCSGFTVFRNNVWVPWAKFVRDRTADRTKLLSPAGSVAWSRSIQNRVRILGLELQKPHCCRNSVVLILIVFLILKITWILFVFFTLLSCLHSEVSLLLPV